MNIEINMAGLVFGGSVTLIISKQSNCTLMPPISPSNSHSEGINYSYIWDTAASARSTTSLRTSSLEIYLQVPVELSNGEASRGPIAVRYRTAVPPEPPRAQQSCNRFQEFRRNNGIIIGSITKTLEHLIWRLERIVGHKKINWTWEHL